MNELQEWQRDIKEERHEMIQEMLDNCCSNEKRCELAKQLDEQELINDMCNPE